MKIKKCNVCEKEVECYNDFNLHYRFGYESVRDGDTIDLDLCGKCLDELVDGILGNCKLNPIGVDGIKRIEEGRDSMLYKR